VLVSSLKIPPAVHFSLEVPQNYTCCIALSGR
jgi:hypothetical protein